ncbi:putative UDP-glucuronosyl/UDP-glucosyltransferase [Helianthus debilis subsp. tardiflorus]
MGQREMAEEHGGRRWRLVLTASPLQGHMTPMLHLATFLHSKGFSITIAHSELNRPDPSNHPGLTFLPLHDNISATLDFANAIQFLQTLNDNCRPHFQEHLVQIINAQKDSSDKETIVIIYDNLMYFAGSVAGDLGLPSIVLRTSSSSIFPAIKIIPQLHQEGRFPVQDCMLQEIVTELNPLRYKDLPFYGLPIKQTLETINMIMPKTPPSAYLWNTLEFLEPSALTQIRDHYQVPVFTVGPLHKIIPTPSSTSFLEEDTSCISWLDKQAPKSVLYVSLGSIANMDEKVSTEMAWGLANSNQPFLWVVRPGSVKGFEWIEFLPEGLVSEMKARGLIVKWAPQKEVLAHSAVGGFWSHCGWNSTLESMFEGVPMLCQPFDLDQKVTTRYLSYVWKMGVEIVVERGEIEGAIRRVLVGKEAEEMKQRAMEIQEKVKNAISDGGSSHNSLKKLVEFIISL